MVEPCLILRLHDMAGDAELRGFRFGEKLRRPEGEKYAESNQNDGNDPSIEP